MRLLRWILAPLFDCAHARTTWPHKSHLGHAYVCCLDCGREMEYFLECMRIVAQDRKRNKLGSRSLAIVGHSRWLPFRTVALCASLLTIFVFPGIASTVKLKPETLKAWQEYVKAAKVRTQDRLNADVPFLVSDDDPARAAKLRTGEILVAPIGLHIPQSVHQDSYTIGVVKFLFRMSLFRMFCTLSATMSGTNRSIRPR